MDNARVTGITHCTFANVQAAKLLGHRAASAPINRSLVIVEEWYAVSNVLCESQIGHEVVEHFVGLASLVHGKYLGLTGTA